MASAIPRRTQQVDGRAALTLDGWSDVRRAHRMPGVREPDRSARPPSLDICRLMVSVLGLSAYVGIPAALVAWVVSDTVAGLGRRLLEMLP